MRLPYEKYLRFLITAGLSYEDSVDHISLLHLPTPTEEEWEVEFDYLSKINCPVHISNYWAPNKPTPASPPKDFFRYMRDFGLSEAWYYNAGRPGEFAEAMETCRVKEHARKLQALLMKKISAEEIASVLHISEKAVYVYKDYIFNTSVMFKADWVQFWQRLKNNAEKKFFFDVFTGSADEVRQMFNLPSQLTYLESLQELHVQAMKKFKQYAADQNPDSDKMAAHWSKVALDTGDRYQKFKTKDIANFGKELQMAFEFVDTEFPSMEDLAGDVGD